MNMENNTTKNQNTKRNIDQNTDSQKTHYGGLIVTSLMVLLFMVCYTMVGNATQTLSELESEKQKNQEQMSSYREQAGSLQETRNELESIVEGLNADLMLIVEKIGDLEDKIKIKTTQLVTAREEYEQAREEERRQYGDMKLRIRYMYEAADNSYMDIFLSNESFSERLNRTEYFMELMKYDRKMLERYKMAKDLKEEKEEQYAKEKEELAVLKEELEKDQELVQEKISGTNEQILMYADSIAEAEKAALEYEQKVLKNQSAIDDESRRIEESRIIEEERRERERRKREQESRERESREKASYERTLRGNEQETVPMEDQDRQQGYGTGYTMQPNDLDMMAALIECEAGDQSYYGMLCVGAVVVNRINSSRFPNTLYEVLYQPYQFSPVTVSNRFALVLARGADETCYQAAREVLEVGNIVGDWLFFRMNDGSRQGEVIEDHVFY